MNRTEINDVAKREIELIRELIPKGEVTKEIKHYRNNQIRSMLPCLSNDAISHLSFHINHQLTQRELLNRLTNDKYKDLSELFRLVEAICHGYSCKFAYKILRLAKEAIVKAAPHASSDEIIELIRDFKPTSFMATGDHYLDILVVRERKDKYEIMKLLESWGIDCSMYPKFFVK